MYQNIEIPFLLWGNRQVLTAMQVMEEHALLEFITAFPRCFERDMTRELYLYYPDGDAPDA